MVVAPRGSRSGPSLGGPEARCSCRSSSTSGTPTPSSAASVTRVTTAGTAMSARTTSRGRGVALATLHRVGDLSLFLCVCVGACVQPHAEHPCVFIACVVVTACATCASCFPALRSGADFQPLRIRGERGRRSLLCLVAQQRSLGDPSVVSPLELWPCLRCCSRPFLRGLHSSRPLPSK